MTYTEFRQSHFDMANKQERTKLYKYKAKSERVHSHMTRIAAEWGTERIIREPNKFRDEVYTSVIGSFMFTWLVAPLINWIVNILLDYFFKSLVSSKNRFGSTSLDLDLKKYAGEL